MVDHRGGGQEAVALLPLTHSEELVEPDGDVHAERVEFALRLDIQAEGRCVPHANRQASLLEGLGYCIVEHLTVDQCAPARLQAREHVQSSHPLAAARRTSGGPDRILSVVGT